MKLTFNEALEKLNDGFGVKERDIQAKALNRSVWVAEWHLPGCLSESFVICETKKDAVECALSMADSPRGMKTSLQKYGRFDSDSEIFGTCINTVTKQKLSDCF